MQLTVSASIKRGQQKLGIFISFIFVYGISAVCVTTRNIETTVLISVSTVYTRGGQTQLWDAFVALDCSRAHVVDSFP